MKIVIPGGTGQVGTVLARKFHSDGHEVVVLSRSPRELPWRVAPWTPQEFDLHRTESELILKSRRVVPGRLLEDGFYFQYPEWPAAAGELCRRSKRNGQ